MKTKQKVHNLSIFKGILALSFVIYGLQPVSIFAKPLANSVEARAEASQPLNQSPLKGGFSVVEVVQEVGILCSTESLVLSSSRQPILQTTVKDSAALNLTQQAYNLNPTLQADCLRIGGAQNSIQQSLAVSSTTVSQHILVKRDTQISSYTLAEGNSKTVPPLVLNSTTTSASKVTLTFTRTGVITRAANSGQPSTIGFNSFRILRC